MKVQIWFLNLNGLGILYNHHHFGVTNLRVSRDEIRPWSMILGMTVARMKALTHLPKFRQQWIFYNKIHHLLGPLNYLLTSPGTVCHMCASSKTKVKQNHPRKLHTHTTPTPPQPKKNPRPKNHESICLKESELGVLVQNLKYHHHQWAPTHQW